jgi:hypothetical protein
MRPQVLWYNNHKSLSAPQLQKAAFFGYFLIGIGFIPD